MKKAAGKKYVYTSDENCIFFKKKEQMPSLTERLSILQKLLCHFFLLQFIIFSMLSTLEMQSNGFNQGTSKLPDEQKLF